MTLGAVVGHAFGNVYVITTRPDADVVRGVNLMKGRPANQVGSLTTTRELVPALLDWSRLPDGLSREVVTAIVNRLFQMGPFGFRGPAGAHIPDHLVAYDGDIRTTQVIAPGYTCPSNALLAQAMVLRGVQFLYITSANRSRHLSGADDEPAHFTAEGVLHEFGHEPNFLVLQHADETAARAMYPLHSPMSTTILGFHKLGAPDEHGRPRLIVERHGSLLASRLALRVYKDVRRGLRSMA